MQMVEVFKTDVSEQCHANMIVDRIHQLFIDYKANFDLEDCDRILRVKCTTGAIHPPCLIELLKDYGFKAELLTDDNQSIGLVIE
jgi:hypothetical protein